MNNSQNNSAGVNSSMNVNRNTTENNNLENLTTNSPTKPESTLLTNLRKEAQLYANSTLIKNNSPLSILEAFEKNKTITVNDFTNINQAPREVIPFKNHEKEIKSSQEINDWDYYENGKKIISSEKKKKKSTRIR